MKKISPAKKTSRKKRSSGRRTVPAKGEIRPRVTLRDIAGKLGVSRMTVSLALRENPRIPKKTRLKVLAAARKLGFYPDYKISRLMSELSHLRSTHAFRGEIAFLTSWQTEFGWRESPYFSKCREGAEQRASELGYSLNDYWTRDPQFLRKKLSGVLRARGVLGIVISPLGAPLSPEQIQSPDIGLDVDWSRYSVIQIDSTISRPQVNIVRHNHFHGMFHSLQQLEGLGYRRIGFAIVQSGDLLTSRLWTAAYLYWLAERSFQEDLPRFVYPYGALPEAAFREWIRDHDIDAVIAMEGEPHPVLARVQKSLSRHVGFSVLDHPGGESPFSGIRQNATEIGQVAVDQLVHAINHDIKGVPLHPAQTLIQGTWHPGTTARKIRGLRRP